MLIQILQNYRTLLVLPEVTDASKWIGGLDAMYLDNEKQYFLIFFATATESEYYNNTKIQDSDKLTVQSLIEPKWAGKISIADPRAGSSLNTLSVLDKLYGDDFIMKFLANKPVVNKEPPCGLCPPRVPVRRESHWASEVPVSAPE